MIAPLIWILIGVVLILSELLSTSIIAVFFGVAAILVGLLTDFELLQSASAQFAAFGVFSTVLLLSLRRYCKAWFMGDTKDAYSGPASSELIGERVSVVSAFTQQQGRVLLNGVQWNALSADTLAPGDVAVITQVDGLTLTVSKKQL